jgi:succinate dehydrogenase/fumarate reductase-like Fe-S protein
MKEDKQRLLKNLEFEKDLIVEMMPLYEKDEDSVNLLLDRLNEIKRLIREIEKELNND